MTGMHTLKPHTKRTRSSRVGRGGKRGKTAGRGTKGQKARAGHRIRPEMRDIIKKLPKRRGHGRNRARTVNDSVIKPIAINLSLLEKRFDGGVISPAFLHEKGLVRTKGGKIPVVKILGNAVSKKFTIEKCLVSAAAKVAIEKAGGEVRA